MRLVEETMRDIPKVELSHLAELLDYILKHRGKQIRPAITLLSGKLHRYNLDLLVPMAAGVELLHIATLIHDDTIDNSVMRRGEPTVNSIWGQSTAILMGDYTFAKSAHLVSTTGNLRVIGLFAQVLMTISSGELDGNSSAFNWEQSRLQYFKRIENKTASLFSTAAQSGAILGNAPEEDVDALKNYGYNLGMAFQIVDDILDFTGDEEEMGKPVGSDLLQGTLTLPAILLMEQYPKDNPIKELFQRKQVEQNLKRAIEIVHNSPVIEQSYAIAADFCSKGRQTLERLPKGASRQSLLELVDYVIERKK